MPNKSLILLRGGVCQCVVIGVVLAHKTIFYFYVTLKMKLRCLGGAIEVAVAISVT